VYKRQPMQMPFIRVMAFYLKMLNFLKFARNTESNLLGLLPR
jgi:hypothetical protein